MADVNVNMDGTAAAGVDIPRSIRPAGDRLGQCEAKCGDCFGKARKAADRNVPIRGLPHAALQRRYAIATALPTALEVLNYLQPFGRQRNVLGVRSLPDCGRICKVKAWKALRG